VVAIYSALRPTPNNPARQSLTTHRSAAIAVSTVIPTWFRGCASGRLGGPLPAGTASRGPLRPAVRWAEASVAAHVLRRSMFSRTTLPPGLQPGFGPLQFSHEPHVRTNPRAGSTLVHAQAMLSAPETQQGGPICLEEFLHATMAQGLRTTARQHAFNPLE
jgi:hypothetical protein